MKPKLIVILGTNASGKSNLGVAMAKQFHGEIVSADSRQVFKGLDLGSGKITKEEMQGVPHHLIDIADVNEFFSVRDFQRLAYEAIDGIVSRGRVPFLVGGTGLYVASVTEGYGMSDTPPDLQYRAYLETFETEALVKMLLREKPNIEIDRKNRNRVMRVLEKIHDGDEITNQNDPKYDCLKLGVTWPTEILRERIDERLERRLSQGMIEEVEKLIQNGATEEFLMKLGLEYRFITRYLKGEFASLEEMKELLAIAIKQFAKRQKIWFRRDEQIEWLDMTQDASAQAEEKIRAFLKS